MAPARSGRDYVVPEFSVRSDPTGLGLGLVLAVLATQAMPDLATMTIPWPTLGAVIAVAVLAGVGAAILPARRASRLNVLDAVQYE